MSDLLPQVDVEADIRRLADLAEKVTHAMRARGETAARADVAYRNARAHAYLAATGTVAEREAQADLACHEQYQDRRLAEAGVDAAKEAGRNYRAQLDALRTIAANQRALVVGS